MKKRWEEPRILVQKFMPNEYVAACGDENKVYNFVCDAPGGTLYYYPRSDGNIDGVYNGSGRSEHVGSYHPCSATHQARVTDDFFDGFVDRNRNGRHDSGEGVIVWLEYDRLWGQTYISDGHATTNLNMKSWTTDKS